METTNEVLKYTTDEVDIATVGFVQTKFFGRKDIKTALAYQDKIDIFDGHILFKDIHKFNVQLKGSETNQNDSIDKKYILSAQTQDLIYFYCPYVFDDNRKMYYKIFNKKEVIENKKYIEMGKTISVSRCDFKEFEYNQFVKELNYFIEENIYTKYVDPHIFMDKFMSGGSFSITGEFNPKKFNDYKVKSIKNISEENGFMYKTMPDKIIGEWNLVPQKTKLQIDIDGKMVVCDKSVDYVGNIRLSFKDAYFDIIWIDEKKNNFKFENNFNDICLLDCEKLSILLKILKSTLKINTDEQLKLFEDFISEANKFKQWLVESNLIDIVSTFENAEIDKLFEEYQYYIYVDKKVNNFPLLKLGENKFIFCNKYNDKLLNMKGEIFAIGNEEQIDVVLNECFIIFMKVRDIDIERLLKSVNVQIEDEVIRLFNGESQQENQKLSKMEVIRQTDYFSNFLLNLIKIYVYTENKDIYDLLLEELYRNINDDIYFINCMQLKKHAKNEISINDYERLEAMLSNTLDNQIKLCCLILLDNYKQKAVFDSLDDDEKEEFTNYPIYRLRNFDL